MSATGIRFGYDFEHGRALDLGRPEAPKRRRPLTTRRVVFYQMLTACDVVTLVGAFAISYWIASRIRTTSLLPFNTYMWLLWVIVPAWLLTLRWFRLYSPVTYSSDSRILLQLARAHAIASLLLLSTMYATKAEVVSRMLMQTFLLVGFVALVGEKIALKLFVARWRGRSAFHRPRVLLIGTPEKARGYFNLVKRDVTMAAEVIGLLAPSPANYKERSSPPAPVLGHPADLPEVLNHNVVDEVVAVLPVEHCDLDWIAASCAARGLVMRMLVEVPQLRAGWDVNDCGEGSFFLSASAVPQDALQLVAKRLLDIIGALAGLLSFGLMWTLYAASIRRQTKSSVLFSQQRVGQNGRLFTLYKFRTMSHDAEQRLAEVREHNQMTGPIFKLKDDPRITPIGSKLRRRHLDELPQFWNVLKGEMSLVGTRPPTPDEVDNYRDVHHRRLSMKPGLTGLWQLSGNDMVSDFEDVVKLDCHYIDNWSLGLDVRIILQTIKKVLRGDAW